MPNLIDDSRVSPRGGKLQFSSDFERPGKKKGFKDALNTGYDTEVVNDRGDTLRFNSTDGFGAGGGQGMVDSTYDNAGYMSTVAASN